MNKQKIKGIVKFYIKQNIQNKWFVVFNVLLLIIFIIMANSANIKEFLDENNINLFNDEMTIEYIDKEDLLGNKLEEAFEEYDKITVKEIEKNDYTVDTIGDNLGVLEVFSDKEEFVKAKFTSKEGIDNSIVLIMEEVLKEVRVEEFSESTNVSKEQLELLNKEISVEIKFLGADAENAETKSMIQMISTFFVYMISIFVFSKISNEIANEKVSKSIEYVLTSVTAKEYLLAKIISIILVIVLQAVLALVYYLMGNLISSLILLSSGAMTLTENAMTDVPAIDVDIVIYIGVLFVYSVLTLILLSIIQAALSSKTTNMSEAGNTMTFLTMLTIAIYFFTLFLITPYTNMTIGIYLLSCIPLLSNYLIPAIMIIGQAKVWQIVLSLVLLIVSIPVTFNICSKIFKNGVLDYSNKKTKKVKVKKEITLKEEQELKLEKSKYRTYALAIGMSIILYFVLQIICELILTTLGASVLEGIFSNSQITLITLSVTSILSLVVPYLFISIYTNKRENTKNTTSKEDLKMFFVAVFFTGLAQIIIILLQNVSNLDNKAVEEILSIVDLDSLFTQILFVFTIAVVPGIFEELFFRKGLINLTKGFGEKFAIVISSLVFAVCHLNITQGIFAFLMGLILGTIYVKTNKMRYNIIIHALNNGYSAIGVILVAGEHLQGYLILNIIIIALLVFSALVVIREIFRKIKSKEKLINLTGKVLPENIKYMFTDFTFLVGAILLILSFVVTEQMLKIM